MSKNNDTDIRKKPILKITILILSIISLLSSGFAIYEIFMLGSIENAIRYIVIGILILLDVLIIFKTKGILKKRPKKKHSKRIGYIIFMVLYTLICLAVALVMFYVYGKLSNMNKSQITYSSSLVVMAKNEANEISDIKDYKIGILDKNNKKSPDGYIIPQEMVEKYKLYDDNELVDYGDYQSMITDLYTSEVDAVILPTDYPAMFSSITGYEQIATDTKIIVSQEKKMRKRDTSEVETESTGKLITEPFTILLMGIDSTDEVLSKNAVANGDTLILVTFNPKTLNATMLSIPRDSYVPIACWSNKAENKITHAAGYGNDCMMNTIEQYLGINIDYYAKINFKGLVKLVNAVGGVDIDVQQTLCTDDSSRGGEICVHPGYQTLDGEHALVYARNRHALVNGDFGRNEHQQEIVLALTNKIKTINNVAKFMEILDTVSNSLDTNLTTQQMLSFYNVAKDIVKKSLASDEADLINIQQLYLAGNSQMIYDERMRRVLYNYIPNENSRKDIVQAMKENLELAEHVPVTEFSFSINEPYEKEDIGKGPYRTSSLYKLVPNFIGNTEAQARAKASKLGLRVTFTGDSSGTVVSQSYPEAKRIDLIKGNIVLTLSNGKNNTSKDDNNTTVKNNDKDKDKDKDKDTDKDKDNNKPATGGDSNTGSGTTPGSDSGSGSGSNPGSTGEPNDKKIDNDD
mgnify:CR=1 FL=1